MDGGCFLPTIGNHAPTVDSANRSTDHSTVHQSFSSLLARSFFHLIESYSVSASASESCCFADLASTFNTMLRRPFNLVLKLIRTIVTLRFGSRSYSLFRESTVVQALHNVRLDIRGNDRYCLLYPNSLSFCGLPIQILRLAFSVVGLQFHLDFLGSVPVSCLSYCILGLSAVEDTWEGLWQQISIVPVRFSKQGFTVLFEKCTCTWSPVSSDLFSQNCLPIF